MSDQALPPPDDVYLIINGKTFGGWEKIRVSRSVEAVASAFSLEITDRWADLSDPWPIYVGDVCAVKFGQETVISGYIDEVKIKIDGTSHTMSVSGRDRTQDVVDCSVQEKEYKNTKLEDIAIDQCKAVGVGVRVEVPTGAPIEKFATQPGETILEALARAAKGKRVLLTSSAQGLLSITKAGIAKVPVTLKEGENILSCEMTASGKERFTKYVVLGQASGEDRTANGIRGVASDKYTKRERTLVILAEDNSTQAYANARAVWEAKTRAGKAVVVSVDVQGWRTPDKLLWRPNTLVNVLSPSCRIDGMLVISSIDYSMDDSGTKTTLSMKRRDAYTDDVEIPKELDPANVEDPVRTYTSYELNRLNAKGSAR